MTALYAVLHYENMDTDFRQAVVKAAQAIGNGGYSRIAKELGLTRQTVSAWQRIPAEHVLKVEELSGVPRHELRPDVYPMPEGIEATQ